ncbi:unnamed protein product [Effrenium voratum]|nr:unnamed protein product [Effrenium voratum]
MAHYLFGEHRPLIGREEFLCRGYPAELPLRGLSDRQMRQLAAKSAPLPLLGAALAERCCQWPTSATVRWQASRATSTWLPRLGTCSCRRWTRLSRASRPWHLKSP